MCDMWPTSVVRKIFTERTRLVVYLETRDLARITATARAAGKTVVEWAREVLVELGDAKAVREAGGLPLAGRRVAAPERLPGESVAAVAVGDGEEHGRKPRTCKHGTERGFRCWQCGGLAVME